MAISLGVYLIFRHTHIFDMAIIFPENPCWIHQPPPATSRTFSRTSWLVHVSTLEPPSGNEQRSSGVEAGGISLRGREKLIGKTALTMKTCEKKYPVSGRCSGTTNSGTGLWFLGLIHTQELDQFCLKHARQAMKQTHSLSLKHKLVLQSISHG